MGQREPSDGAQALKSSPSKDIRLAKIRAGEEGLGFRVWGLGFGVWGGSMEIG